MFPPSAPSLFATGVNLRHRRKLLEAYWDAIDEYLRSVATVMGGRILSVDTDGKITRTFLSFSGGRGTAALGLASSQPAQFLGPSAARR